ncbi:MAG TPA: HAD-IIIA family hydrolase [Egibacteraceae bacterium]|nr:HAD-IIIA family hydrolase [Egibacteraceae bacterium]
MSVAVVVPTLARPSLAALLDALAAARGPLPEQVVLVHDRPGPEAALPVRLPARLTDRVVVLSGPGRGPAAARNTGWRAADAEWIAFLDDDVVPASDWLARLADDLDGLPAVVAGSQGRVHVPLPGHRRPTDWERNVAGLERARWATADLAYRRVALAAAGGFDERFPRAYREDADLGLRLVRAGWRIVRGGRTVAHPPRPAGPWVSVRLQAGNADDPLMRALHGAGWRQAAGVPRGRRGRHLAITAAGAAAAAGLAQRPGPRTRRGGRGGRSSAADVLAVAGAAGWLAGTAELAWARIAPGPRTPGEVATMLATSVVLPAAASVHWLRGVVAARGVAPAAVRFAGRPHAVLLDRDGTLVVDVPYNGDPDKVEPMPGARAALDRLRAADVPLAVVSNQSGVGRGLLTADQVAAVNRRVDELLGPFAHWAVCPHAPGEGCGCRKPAAGLVREAASALGVPAERCAVVGDIGADVAAAAAAGAHGVLVPTARTRAQEIEAAPVVAPDLDAAVDLLLGGQVARR